MNITLLIFGSLLFSQTVIAQSLSPLPSENIKEEIFLAGNFFKKNINTNSIETLNYFNTLIDADKKHQHSFLLGNVVPHKALEEDSPFYNELTENIGNVFQSFKDKSNNVYYIPGNNEWYDGEDYTVKGLKQTEKFIELNSSEKNRFLPSKGCGDPQIIKLGNKLVVIIIDSQWMMQGESSSERKKSSCEADNNFEFIAHLKEILSKQKSKQVIILSHHPVYSNGKLGGNYQLVNHLLPLPILGTIITSIRKLAVNEQYFGHPDYEAYRAAMKSVLNNYENCVIVSSHENNLQYHFDNANHFVTVGSGVDSDYCRKANDDNFALGKRGYSRIILTDKEALVIELYQLDGTSGSQLVYQKTIPPKVTKLDDSILIESKENLDDIINTEITIAASKMYSKKRFLRGKFYRKAWRTEVTVPAIMLSNEHGGLKPVQQGGGFQTQSLRLENDEGQQWVLRSVNKDVEKIVPPELRGTFAQNMIQDGIASSHPFGAFAIPHLAQSAGILHAHPKLVYLPYQKALGDYNADFGEKIYLYEERPGGNTSKFEHYDFTKKTINTLDLLDNLEKNHKHVVDQKAVLRARLFDIFVGDWDRHDDQWRWASFEEDNITIYKPIPRDRDQVFFKNDGILDYLASRPYFNPGLRKFDHKIDFLPGLIFNARHFDRSFLNQLTKDDFVKMAEELQQKLSDQVIDEAFLSWPQEIQDIDAYTIKDKLKSRRKDLVKYAKEFYDHIFKEVTISGTNDQNLFQIELLENNQLHARLYEDKKKKKHLLYDQILNGNITKELRLFGLSKDDEFIIEGEYPTKILIRAIGGSGDDQLINNSEACVIAYDRPKKMELSGSNIKSKLKDVNGINSYNRKDWKQNRFWQFPMLSFYTDEGIGLSYNIWWKKFGFRSKPFKSDHKLTTSFFFKNKAISLNYQSYYPNLINKLDVAFDLKYNGPSFTQFFYGFGNEYIDFEEQYPQFANADDQSFHFVKGTHLDFNTHFIKELNSSSKLQFNPSFEFYNIKNMDEDPRFYLLSDSNIPEVSFEPKYYGAIGLSFISQRLDLASLPSQGYSFSISADGKLNLTDSNYKSINLSTELSAYIPFNLQKSIVLSTYLGYHHLLGDKEFFHYNYLASKTRLRAFRTNRFSGDRMAFHSTDLRIGLLKSKGDLPTVFGIIASMDYGRVWLNDDNENNNKWHTSIGGGVYFAPVELVGFRVSYHKAPREFQLNIGGSLTF